MRRHIRHNDFISKLPNGYDTMVGEGGSIDRLIAGRTVIMIAHRLKTVAREDKIIFMDKGRGIEQGKHQELIDNKSLYARLWDLQTKTSGWQL